MQKLFPAQIGGLHFYQFDGSHRNPNECALCAMTTLLHMAARQSAIHPFDLEPAALGRFLDRIPFRYPRFPAWFPRAGGATHPKAARDGLRAYIRRLWAQGVELAWGPVLRTRQTEADLAAALEAGYPTLIYGVGATGIPHAVVPIGKKAAEWLVLDPGTQTGQNPMHWSNHQLRQWWVSYGWIYPEGTMVSLKTNPLWRRYRGLYRSKAHPRRPIPPVW